MVKDYVGTLRMGHVGTTASENAPHDTDTAMSVCAIVKIVLKKDMPGEPANQRLKKNASYVLRANRCFLGTPSGQTFAST